MLARIMRMRLRGGLMGSRLRVVSLLLIILGTAGLGFVLYEMRTSRLQAKVLSDVATQLDYSVAPGPSHAIDFPKAGPYDERLGYVELPEITQRLHEQGFEIVAQARHSPMLRYVTRAGLFIPYEKKSQAGLQILDRNGQVIFATAYPGRLYSNFDAVPEILVVSLLFIENRELLDEQMPYKNPAVEWDRFAKAVVDMGIKQIKKDHEAPGGSTLATQIEKYQHSPGGRTPSGGEKIRQMASASLRAYLDGAETLEARRQLVVDYINSIPLGAVPGYGEIIGIGDGLWAWYGLELEAFNQLLEQQPDNAKAPNLAEWALAYKQMLSLLLAQRRPTFYLLESHESLEERTNSYVRALTNGGVLRPFERDAILKARLQVQKNQVLYRPTSFTERKAANAIRPRLLSLLGVEQLYELDRFDLTVQSTLDTRIQEEVTRKLRQLRDPAEAAAAGLNGYRILEQGDPAGVIYSFTLYERGDNVNLLRAQTDNFNQPLNINEGVKLELGSTAKLRTLITYLHIVSELHTHYAGLSNEALRAVSGPEADNLSRWAIAYLLNTEDRALRPMLMTAMERHYSASPHERFFTGGGQHTFSNYDRADNGRIMSVREAFHESVNLVFIRVMRDCVRYYMYQRPGIVELFENPEDPRREAYLIRFADKEGQVYQRRFYRKYQGKNGLEILELLAESISYPQPARYATVFRSVAPEGGIEAFSTFVRSHLPHSALSDEDLQELYDKYAITAFSLHDRGYIARIHPLELWTAAYLRANPTASLKETLAASIEERKAVYGWLFKTGRKHKQDLRIQSLVEAEAFEEVLRVWKKTGYPFDYLVPSYATAIGVSGDRPAALAELVGILLNDGIRYPSIRVQSLHFGEGTPFDTHFDRERDIGRRVLHPEIAAIVRGAMLGVVEQGTARRVNKAFLAKSETPSGSPPERGKTLRQGKEIIIPVGGKTGTGDNRRDVYSARGRLIESQVISRTATFVFFIGDRFFGTIIAYVPGKEAEGYRFTSALPVQVLKHLAPTLMPLIEGAEQERKLEPHFAAQWEGTFPSSLRLREADDIIQRDAADLTEQQDIAEPARQFVPVDVIQFDGLMLASVSNRE